MTIEIGLTFGILAIAIILFISERLRADLIALLVMGSLILSGVVTAEEGFSGFSNQAIVTIWAVYILSGGLARTGIANLIGRQIMRILLLDDWHAAYGQQIAAPPPSGVVSKAWQARLEDTQGMVLRLREEASREWLAGEGG